MWVLAVQVNSQPDYPEIDKDPDKSHELFRGPNRNNSSKLQAVLSTNTVISGHFMAVWTQSVVCMLPFSPV